MHCERDLYQACLRRLFSESQGGCHRSRLDCHLRKNVSALNQVTWRVSRASTFLLHFLCPLTPQSFKMASDDNNRSLVEHQSEGQQNGAGSMTGTPSKNPMPSTFPQATNGHSPREKQISSDETVVDEHQDDENANNDQDSDMILSDLPEFDWVGFLRKWEESFKAATNEENELLSHFQHLSEVVPASSL